MSEKFHFFLCTQGNPLCRYFVAHLVFNIRLYTSWDNPKRSQMYANKTSIARKWTWNEREEKIENASRKEREHAHMRNRETKINEWMKQNEMKWKKTFRKRGTLWHTEYLSLTRLVALCLSWKNIFDSIFRHLSPLPHAFQFSEAVQNMYIELVFCRTVLFPVAAVAVMTQPYSNSKNNNKICTHQPLFLTHNLSLSLCLVRLPLPLHLCIREL